MKPTNNLGYLLQHLAFTMARQNDQILQERLGLGFSQFKILMVLSRNPYIKQRDIAEALGQTEASISRQIKLMLKQGLLQITVRPENRRQHLTTPTDKGLDLTDSAMRVLNGFHGPMFTALSSDQRQALLSILSRMHETLCQPGKAGACDHPYNL